MRRHWPLLALLCFSIYGAALYHRALWGRAALFWHDVSIAYLPLRTAAAEAMRAGHLPLWESRLGNGFPVLAEGQAGVFYPPHLIGLLGLPQYHVYAILLVAHCVLAALFMALLCRLWGLRTTPCLTAGLVYGFSGFFVCHAIHITMVEAAAWLPAALYCCERWLREPRAYPWLAGAAAALGLQELVAMPQILLYSVLTVVLYMLTAALVRGHEGPQHSLRRIATATSAVLAGALLLSAVQVLPTRTLAGHSERAAVTASKLRELALAPRNLAYFIHPYILGSYAEGNYFGRDHHYEVCGFVGTIALLFGLVGFRYGTGHVRVFAALAVPLALFMALANQNPLYELFPHIPGFNAFRGAGRYLLISTLGLAVLTAWGLHAVGQSRRALRGAVVLALVGTGLTVALWLGFHAVRGEVARRLEQVMSVEARAAGEGERPALRRREAREKAEYLAWRLSPRDPLYLMVMLSCALPAAVGGLALRGRADPRWIGEVALALTVVQLYLFGRDYNPTVERAYYDTQPQLAALTRPQEGECLYMHDQEAVQRALGRPPGWATGDLSFYFQERETLRPNRPLLYGLRSANVFYALVPERYWVLTRLLEASIQRERDPATGLQMQAPAAVLSALGARVICTARRDVLPGLRVAGQFRVWLARRNDYAVPLAYFARGSVPVPGPREALQAMCSPDFNPWRPVVETAPGAPMPLEVLGSEANRVTAVHNDYGCVTVHCQVRQPGLLVLRETWDPHFRCTVDGRPVPIHRVNYLFRGVEVPPGEHEVRFVYRPVELWLGAAICVAAWVVAGGIVMRGRRKGRG